MDAVVCLFVFLVWISIELQPGVFPFARESKTKTLNSCPLLPQVLTDFQTLSLSDSAVHLQHARIYIS